MEIRPLRTEQDHDEALREIERLWGADPDTPEGDRLDVLATLVEAYERAHWPMDPPDPIAAIRFRLDQQGLDERALIGVIGPAGRVRAVMSGRRPLTLPMIRRLHETFGIPAEILIRDVEATPKSIRLRKRILDPNERKKESRKAEAV